MLAFYGAPTRVTHVAVVATPPASTVHPVTRYLVSEWGVKRGDSMVMQASGGRNDNGDNPKARVKSEVSIRYRSDFIGLGFLYQRPPAYDVLAAILLDHVLRPGVARWAEVAPVLAAKLPPELARPLFERLEGAYGVNSDEHERLVAGIFGSGVK